MKRCCIAVSFAAFAGIGLAPTVAKATVSFSQIAAGGCITELAAVSTTGAYGIGCTLSANVS